MSKKFLEKDMSRREFMKLSGKGVAGLMVSASFLSLIGCSREDIETGKVGVTAMPAGVLVSYKSRCVGCQRCEMNCSIINDGKVQPYLSRVKVGQSIQFGDNGAGVDYQLDDGMYGNFTFTQNTCRQCEKPACLEACPQEAIYVDENTGIRKVNEEKCVGCGACTNACPWNMPTVDEETKKSTKCIACGECAKGCPTGALKIVTWEEAQKLLV